MNESTSNVNPSTDEIYLSEAQRSTMLANGYPWLPGFGKAVYLNGWETLDVTEGIMEWFASETPQWDSWRNTGCQLGRVVIAADNDIPDETLAAKVQTHIDNHLGSSPCVRIGSKGQAALYRVDMLMRSIVIRGVAPGGTERKTAVEFLGLERQLMAFGHVDANPAKDQPAFNYRWPDKSPLDTPLSDLPLATHSDVMAAAKGIRDELAHAGWTDLRISESATEADKDSAHKDAKKGNGGLISLKMLKEMLACIDPGIGRKESSSWISVLGALKHAEACELVCLPDTFEPDPNFDAEAVAVAWSRGDLWKNGQPSNFMSEEDVAKNFADLSPFAPKGSTIASIVRMAYDGGYCGRSRIDGMLERFELDTPERATPDAVTPSAANNSDPDESLEDLFPVFAESEGLEGPPLDWVIPGILPMGYQVMLYGEEQSLKTYVMLEMMECAMTGHQFAQVPGDESSGLPVLRPGLSAMMICGEGFEGVKKQRHPLWRKHHEVQDSESLPFYTMNVMPSFLDRKAVEKLARSIKAKCGDKVPDLIGIDTLVYALAPDGKEDSNDDATKIYNAGKYLMRLLGKPLIIFWVHHVGHSAVRTRGAYNWKGSSDIRFRLEHVKAPVSDGNGGRSYHVRMICEKLKDAPLPAPIEFRGRTVFDKDKDGHAISTVLLSGVPTGSLMDRADSTEAKADSGDVQDVDKLTVADVVRLVLDKAEAGRKLSPGDVAKEADSLGLLTGKAATFDRNLRNIVSKATNAAREARKPLEGLYTWKTMRSKDGNTPVYEFIGQGGKLGVWAAFEASRQVDERDFDFGSGDPVMH